ncbi:unnamed protein product [Amoebophrya sp. A120]|nr:unnamed protein product [Amoebophrya sp. A120]|eukprot:GSA120T00010212001.1
MYYNFRRTEYHYNFRCCRIFRRKKKARRQQLQLSMGATRPSAFRAPFLLQRPSLRGDETARREDGRGARAPSAGRKAQPKKLGRQDVQLVAQIVRAMKAPPRLRTPPRRLVAPLPSRAGLCRPAKRRPFGHCVGRGPLQVSRPPSEEARCRAGPLVVWVLWRAPCCRGRNAAPTIDRAQVGKAADVFSSLSRCPCVANLAQWLAP